PLRGGVAKGLRRRSANPLLSGSNPLAASKSFTPSTFDCLRRPVMAELIKRVGPPKATDLKGDEFTWTIQLSAAPSREWSRIFSEPADSTVLCHPRRLGIMHQAIVFKADEGHLPTWVQYIDKWIGGAKRGRAEQEEAERQRKARALAEEEDGQGRMGEVNEKVKNLGRGAGRNGNRRGLKILCPKRTCRFDSCRPYH